MKRQEKNDFQFACFMCVLLIITGCTAWEIKEQMKQEKTNVFFLHKDTEVIKQKQVDFLKHESEITDYIKVNDSVVVPGKVWLG